MTWSDYQDEVAKVFREFGANAAVESEAEGARGKHKIDVEVELEIHGITSKWICECKLWKKAVEKSAILTFHSIVNDVGADRGFFFSESGFQAGAISFTKNTNITLTSLSEFRLGVKEEIAKSSLLFWLNRIGKIRRTIKPAWTDDTLSLRFHKTISFDKCVYLDGVLLIMAPKIQDALDDNYPIYLASYSGKSSILCSNFEELDFQLSKDFKIIENEVQEITDALNNPRLNIQEDKNSFILSVNNLISYSDKCLYNSPSENDLLTISKLMKEVGLTSSFLKSSSSGSLEKQLSLIMKFLIDAVYPHFLEETDSLEDWKTTVNEIKKYLTKLDEIEVF